MKTSPVLMLYAAAGAAGLFVAWKLANAAKDGAEAVGKVAREVITTDLNPASTGNVVNRGVSAVGAAVSGDSSWSLGGWLAGVTGADRDAEVKAMLQGTPQTRAQALYQAPPTTNGAPVPITQPPVSFLNSGGSFKDLAQPDGFLNTWATYGGGLSFERAPW